ncbi:MAG: hypothetical protein HRT88_14470, partial [Lentisphaeraceae bacterium]|nr:hypothetical protein [Lentisphaeraceae bacterium]
LAWNSLEGRFSNKVREAYLMSLKGVHYLDIGTQLDISPGSVQVYKNRIEKALI